MIGFLFQAVNFVRPIAIYGLGALGLDKVISWFSSKEQEAVAKDGGNDSVTAWTWLKVFFIWLLPLGGFVLIGFLLWKFVVRKFIIKSKRSPYRRKHSKIGAVTRIRRAIAGGGVKAQRLRNLAKARAAKARKARARKNK